MRHIRVVLEIEVADLPAAEMKELYEESPDFVSSPAQMRAINKEASAHEIVEGFKTFAESDIQREYWAGSELYLWFTKIEIKEAAFVGRAAPAQDWRPIESGWINIYENPPGASAVPCSCIWPTKEIADKNQLTTSPRKACVQVSWPSPSLAETK